MFPIMWEFYYEHRTICRLVETDRSINVKSKKMQTAKLNKVNISHIEQRL